MTTEAAAALYLAQHNHQHAARVYAHFNPHNKPLHELPVIYGFNNGGGSDCLSAVLIAEDGTTLGGHICSHEGYMKHDLGILEGTRPDRHETFQKHYPDGYRMDFVGYSDVRGHAGLKSAFEKFEAKDRAKDAQPVVVEDFLADSKACDLSNDKGCEACQ